MPIYIDVSAAVHRRAGWGRYAESLARALADQIPEDLALFFNRERGIDPLDGLTHLSTATVALGYKPWRMLVWMGQLSRAAFNRLVPGAQLFHATEHLLPPLRDVPTVLTVHDLIFQLLPEHHKWLNRWYLRWTLPLYCRRASHIIAVSEATRNDLITAYDLPPEKVSVIYEAAAAHFQPEAEARMAQVRAKYHLPPHYLLTVGTIEPRKNLTRVLEAWAPLYLRKEVPPLVIVGKRGWLYDEFFTALAASPARDGVIFPGYVDDADLPAVYTAATALVFASLYEGFGLPPLEAMASGTPVVCANTSSLPEVVGEAALMFDPYDVEALGETLYRVVHDGNVQEALITQGLERASHFSWAQTARETLDVYQRLMNA